uniref:Choline transporter-like protein n=1 Tax=Pyrodinium bahamense TaxID=73915 RepID=A0A7S0FKL2_9DINO|mmetsp:Transcript_37114/g.103287  ORF Transcript_37114/g.103287 Transcript_37114/m.103287 type:complete len:611 (+) Transcript_37114:57-1889(+)
MKASIKGSNYQSYGGGTPLTVHRGCTDVQYLIAFAITVLGLVGIIASGTAGEDQGHFRCPFGEGDGDLMRFGELRDFEGNVCGEEGRGRYLYFCKMGKSLDLKHHTCVEECPRFTNTSTQCYDQDTNTFKLITDYPTVNFAGLFCMPADNWLKNEVDGMLLRSRFMEYMLKFSEASRARELLGLAGVNALVLAFAYLFLLQHFTHCLLWVGIIVVVSVPGLIGGILIYASQTGGLDNGPLAVVDEEYDLRIGACAVGLSVLCFMMALCKRELIIMAAQCLEQACECIFAVPSLVVEPLFALIGRIALFVPLLTGLLLLLSCGNVTDSVDLTKQTFFKFNRALILLVAYYAFMTTWIMELCTAVSQFVVAYTVQLWWFEDGQRGGHRSRAAWGVIHGYCIALEHHLGSLLFGSLAITFVRSVRMAVGILVAAADDTGNPLGACLGESCCCFIECYKRFLEYVNKNAYMDIAMNGGSFCTASAHALEVMMTEGTAAVTMSGATSILQLAGLGGISATGAFLTWELSTQWSIFADPGSEHYVQDPMYLAILAAVVSFVVALPFLHIFDIVSDTILFCEAHEEINRREDKELAQSSGCLGSCARLITCSPQALH